MAGSPPCFQLRCSNPTFGWAVLGARGPLGVQGETPVMPSLRPPSPSSFLRLLRSPCLDPNPVLFLSPPPWWIPHNPPRDLPPRRLLFLFALVSLLPLTFHRIQSGSSLWNCFGVPTTGPRLAVEYRLLVRSSHHLPFSSTKGCDLTPNCAPL